MYSLLRYRIGQWLCCDRINPATKKGLGLILALYPHPGVTYEFLPHYPRELTFDSHERRGAGKEWDGYGIRGYADRSSRRSKVIAATKAKAGHYKYQDNALVDPLEILLLCLIHCKLDSTRIPLPIDHTTTFTSFFWTTITLFTSLSPIKD